jgi:flagellar motor switch protein FliN/FliY
MPDDPVPVSVPPHALAGGGGGAAAARRGVSTTNKSDATGLPVFKSVPPQPENRPTLDALRDVELDVTIELGRTRMRIEDVLKLSQGAVVELNRLAGEPVDVYVSDRLVARGDVVVLNDNFAVRVTQVISPLADD